MNILTDEEIATIHKPYGEHSISGFDHVKAYTRAIETLIAVRIAAKLKDADRYRWLIEQHWVQSEVDWRLIPTQQESTIEQLGEAIDAAMRGKKK